jgi:hypothetical protein
MKPMLKPPGTKRLKLKCDIPLATSAFKVNLRRYSKESDPAWRAMQVKRQALPAGRCRLTLSNPRCNLKAPGTERLKLEYDKLLSSFAFRVNSRRYIPAFAMRTELIDAIEGGACPRYTPCIPL